MLWIRFGKVSNIIQYTLREYREKMIETENWEFWDLVQQGVIV